MKFFFGGARALPFCFGGHWPLTPSSDAYEERITALSLSIIFKVTRLGLLHPAINVPALAMAVVSKVLFFFPT